MQSEISMQEIRGMKRDLERIENTLKTKGLAHSRGRQPILLSRLHQLMADRYGYNNGLTIDDISKTMYGVVGYETKQRARMLFRLLRKKYGLVVYSVQPMGRGMVKKYCILNSTLETKQVRKHIDSIQNGLTIQEKKLKKREREIQDGTVKMATKTQAKKVKKNG